MKFILIQLAIILSNLFIVSTLAKPSPIACKIYLCLCIDANRIINILVTCPNQAANKCYANGECIVQSDGQCGFTKSPILENCLYSASPNVKRKGAGTVSPNPQGNCKRGGCNGTYCSQTNIITTCIFRLGDECYQYANCVNYRNDCIWKFNKAYYKCRKEALKHIGN